ncbi:hypothetical protein CDAR_80551 [Caerostris darwini]|uniref:Secreted protein n=1 Tax=Caerostris darwini TaxID=1538125 RepID=A0AAV4SPU5_9ARAC|nr:hypothetical protein CDAR_80551 [Caerostris darwini]
MFLTFQSKRLLLTYAHIAFVASEATHRTSFMFLTFQSKRLLLTYAHIASVASEAKKYAHIAFVAIKATAAHIAYVSHIVFEAPDSHTEINASIAF